MRQRTSWSLLLCALVLFLFVLPTPPATGILKKPESPTLPDTHAGRCAASALKMFNADDDETTRAFEKSFRAKSALERRPIEQRVRQVRELRDQWGALTLARIVRAEERAITIITHSAKRGEHFEMQFDFEPKAPYGLLGIMIRGPVDPEAEAEEREPIDADIRKATIDAVSKALENGYVFPEVAKKMALELQNHLAEGKYDATADADAFAAQLSDDLQAVSHDKHLRVVAGRMENRMRARQDPRESARNNYGFVRVERMPGNIGYMKLNMFHPSAEAQRTAAAGLAFLANCDALIFDVRDNGGGSPEMIKFISSYLFDKPTHLNSFFDRTNNKTEEFWTAAEIDGKRFGEDLPVYVLTSGYTFSGAEEFTYNLKNLKRATIVGATTGGGAHPVKSEQLNEHFSMMVPFARAVNPITGTNWEGVGVSPDIETAADEALDVAHQHAVERIRELR